MEKDIAYFMVLLFHDDSYIYEQNTKEAYNMEKRFRDYIRHFEKLDFDVLSEEEVEQEKEEIGLHVDILQHEMLRKLVVTMGIFICACIIFSAGIIANVLVVDIIGIAIFICGIVMAFSFKESKDAMTKLCVFVDKLTML